MKLKSFKIFESISELKTILNDALVDLVDEFDPEFSLNDLEVNESVVFTFNFEYKDPFDSNVESMKKHIEQSQQKTDIYRKFLIIMKKLDQAGYNSRMTQRKSNTGLVIQLYTNIIHRLSWLSKGVDGVVIDCEQLNIYLNKYSMKLTKIKQTEEDDVSVIRISYQGLDHSEQELLGQDKVKIQNDLLNTYIVDDNIKFEKKRSANQSFGSTSIVLNIGYDVDIINLLSVKI